MSVINDAQMNCVCALSITITSYFCLNTAQYIHVVEYSECFITECSRVLEKFVRISGVYGHQMLQTACSYRGTIYWWRRE